MISLTKLILFLILLFLILFVYFFSGPDLVVQECLSVDQVSPSYHIVVAKYKEDISWFSHMDQGKMHVYDKSGEKSPYIPLENKGREGATFLGHIIKYYDNLPDYLILLQGNPFPHMRSDITPDNLQENISRLVEERPTQTIPLFCDYGEEKLYTFKGLMMDQYHELMFEGTPNPVLRFAAGNQYLVPRKDILKRPKDFYMKLWKMSIKGDHYELEAAHNEEKTLNPNEMIGWSLERIFPTIVVDDVPIKDTFLDR